MAEIRGYLCDGGCGGFYRSQPAANYEHNAWITDENGAVRKRMLIDAQLCEDCAIEQSRRWHLYEQREVIAALEEDDE